MDLEQAWKYIFADMSEFFGEYHRQRGAVDIKISPWNVLERRKTPEFCRCRAIRKVEAVVPVPSTYFSFPSYLNCRLNLFAHLIQVSCSFYSRCPY